MSASNYLGPIYLTNPQEDGRNRRWVFDGAIALSPDPEDNCPAYVHAYFPSGTAPPEHGVFYVTGRVLIRDEDEGQEGRGDHKWALDIYAFGVSASLFVHLTLH